MIVLIYYLSDFFCYFRDICILTYRKINLLKDFYIIIIIVTVQNKKILI